MALPSISSGYPKHSHHSRPWTRVIRRRTEKLGKLPRQGEALGDSFLFDHEEVTSELFGLA